MGTTVSALASLAPRAVRATVSVLASLAPGAMVTLVSDRLGGRFACASGGGCYGFSASFARPSCEGHYRLSARFARYLLWRALIVNRRHVFVLYIAYSSITSNYTHTHTHTTYTVLKTFGK